MHDRLVRRRDGPLIHMFRKPQVIPGNRMTTHRVRRCRQFAQQCRDCGRVAGMLTRAGQELQSAGPVIYCSRGGDLPLTRRSGGGPARRE